MKSVIGRYAALRPSYGDVRFEEIFDDVRGRFALVQCGWDDERVMGVVIYVIVDEHGVHIEEDGIEHGISDELIQLGVDEQDIDFPPYESEQTSARPQRPEPVATH